MGKKDKKKKNNSSELEKKYIKLDKEMMKSRLKMLKLNAKLAKMDVEDYAFKDKDGNDVKLSQMFDNKNELIVIHNMGKSCSYCTMWADGFNGIYPHIEKRSAFALISPDAFDVQKAFAGERGWKFRMYSGKDSSFIKDMGYYTEKNGYWPGASVFHKEDGKITRISKTIFGPGDYFCSVWHFFDMLPKSDTK
jgi:predicted dithiol-disulfide oxidoreductase (DUF899 family)